MYFVGLNCVTVSQSTYKNIKYMRVLQCLHTTVPLFKKKIGQLPPMHGGVERIISVFEMSRDTQVERGAPEDKMARDQRENSNQEYTHCQSATKLRIK